VNEYAELVRALAEQQAKIAADLARRGRFQGAYGPGRGRTFHDDDETTGPDSGGGDGGGGGRPWNPMEAAGDLIYGGEAGGAERLPIGTAGQLLTAAVIAGELVPSWASAAAATVGLRYRTPVTTTAGGGDLLWDRAGELVETRRALE
jgi:hypothetical protein